MVGTLVVFGDNGATANILGTGCVVLDAGVDVVVVVLTVVVGTSLIFGGNVGAVVVIFGTGRVVFAASLVVVVVGAVVFGSVIFCGTAVVLDVGSFVNSHTGGAGLVVFAADTVDFVVADASGANVLNSGRVGVISGRMNGIDGVGGGAVACLTGGGAFDAFGAFIIDCGVVGGVGLVGPCDPTVCAPDIVLVSVKDFVLWRRLLVGVTFVVGAKGVARTGIACSLTLVDGIGVVAGLMSITCVVCLVVVSGVGKDGARQVFPSLCMTMLSGHIHVLP